MASQRSLIGRIDAILAADSARDTIRGPGAAGVVPAFWEDPACPLLRDLHQHLGNHRVAQALYGSEEALDTQVHDAMALAMGGVVVASSLQGLFQEGPFAAHAAGGEIDSLAADLGPVARQHAPGDPEDGNWGAAAEQAVDDARHAGGRALPAAVRERLERTLGGADLSAMRVHTGPEAARAAAGIHAEAYTLGQDVYFGDGAWQPDSDQGLRLLAHEATHVVQFQEGRLARSAGNDGLSVSSPDDATEVEAEQVAASLAPAAAALDPSAEGEGTEAMEGVAGLPAARFSKENHEETERQGFEGIFSDAEQRQIYRGNWEQDVSQLPTGALVGFLEAIDALLAARRPEEVQGKGRLLAFLLERIMDAIEQGSKADAKVAVVVAVGMALGSVAQNGIGSPFGGYQPESHMDRPDARTASSDVIQASRAHIVSLLQTALLAGHTPIGLENLGAACHTVEDYFAHSSYVEIARGERSDVQMSIYDAVTDAAVSQSELLVDYLTRLGQWARRMLGLDRDPAETGQRPENPERSGLSVEHLVTITALATTLRQLALLDVDRARASVQQADPEHAEDHHSFLAKDHENEGASLHNGKVDQAMGFAAQAIRAISAPLVAEWWPRRDEMVQRGDLSDALVARESVRSWKEAPHGVMPLVRNAAGLITRDGESFLEEFNTFYEDLLAQLLPTEGAEVPAWSQRRRDCRLAPRWHDARPPACPLPMICASMLPGTGPRWPETGGPGGVQ